MGRPNFGHIERLGHDRYRVWWGRGYRPDGKRDRHSATVHGTRAEAEVFLASKVSASGAPTRTETWEVFWLAHVEPTFDGLAVRTVNDYRAMWERHLRPHVAHVRVSDTDEALVDMVLSRIQSPATQRHVKDLWRKACRIAVRLRILDRCPIDSATRLRPLRTPPKVLLDASEVSAWMSGIRGCKYELALLLMLGGGLRPEEAYGLHFGDVSDWDGYALVRVSRALTYSHGKVLKAPKTGASTREVVVGAPFAERVLELASWREGPILPSGRGSGAEAYTSPSTACNNYRAWCQRHGVKYVPPKNLRASYATMHGEAGSPDSLVSGSMGHTDRTTKGAHYQAITRRGLVLIADNLAAFLAAL